ncbi:MAG: hypothetical protein CR986_02175 [Ignavibacteriae bacterium]|nr:MAG: hypothetical protein CR986_02175 [Ignavibacteriota bacterium]
MKKLFYIFLSRPVTSAMLLFTIVGLGIFSSFNLPLELSPQIDYPKLTINIRWSNVSPETMEAFVTSPIEAEMNTIRGVKTISSNSSVGNSRIELEFYPDVDMNFTKIEINEKIASIRKELPEGISQPKVSDYVPKDLMELQGFLTYTISSNKSSNEIRKYVKENIYYKLKSINGVEDVYIQGGNEREISILIDYDKAKNLNLTNQEISNSIMSIENIQPLGKIISGNKQYFVRANNNISDLNVIKNHAVKIYKNGKILRLKDIATVIDDFRESRSYYRINGKETVTIIINKEQGKNALDVAESVYNQISEIERELPDGYFILKEVDKSEKIRDELKDLSQNAVYSFIIILLVLLIIFRSLKISVIIILSILFSLFFSFLLFFIFELPLNILTISAFILGFGFMVDNSIVVVDFIEQNDYKNNKRRLTILLKNIFKPVLASTLTTIAVFLPLLFLSGELRLYFEQFALGIVFTLFASLVISFTIIPMLFERFVLKKIFMKNKKDKLHLLERIYLTITKFIFRWKKLSFALLILLVGLPVWLLPARIENETFGPIYNSIFDTDLYNEIKPYVNYTLGGSLNLFFNHIDRGEVWKFGEETYIAVRLELPNGNDISRINNLTKNFENEILMYKKNIKSLITYVRNPENASLRIEFTEKQSNTAFPYILKNYITAYATRLGGLNVSVYGFGPGFSNGGNSFSNFSVIVKGFNYLRTKELAEEFRKIISKNPRIDNVDIDKTKYFWVKDVYEIIATIKRKQLSVYNTTPSEIIDNISKSIAGNLVWNRFRIDNDEVQYNVKFNNFNSIQLDDLENIIMKSNTGKTYKVKDVVDFKISKVIASINREDQQYVRYITFDYKGPYKYGNKFIKNSIENMHIKEGYSLKMKEFTFLFGKEEETEVWTTLIVAVIIIFMITASLFESLRKPLLIILAIPFAFIGTFILFYFMELNLDRGAYAGLLLLVGLVVNNSIILVDYISHRNKKNNYLNLLMLSKDRIRPIFTTTLTTIAALIPLLISTEATFWRSLSYSVVGGIFLSAVIVVLYLPVIYFLMKKRTQ